MMADSFIRKQKILSDGYNVRESLKMFGVSKSGYYAWINRKKDKKGVQARREADERHVKDMMLAVIRKRSGVIPGKRIFRLDIWRMFGERVNVKRIARLMKAMKLVAQKPIKDAYKHQASHNHPCAAPANGVGQDFFVGPRQVILTDITYLYYGSRRTTFYLCVFRDAYTRENLGWASGGMMDVGLIKRAYVMMMDDHGEELKERCGVYIHSDQGSQYLSTTFVQMLEDDGFVQSVSARGNSQDNAPMESFFGRMKTDILSLVAMCDSLDAAMRLVDGYITSYNTERYQYGLAGLTPCEFYEYATTGVYPLESYFGVPREDMMAVGDLGGVRRAYADEQARKRREASKKHREKMRIINPINRIHTDQGLLDHMISQWRQTKNRADIQIDHLKEILESTKKALAYVLSLSEEKRDELRDPLNWRKHEELNYVFAMNEMF